MNQVRKIKSKSGFYRKIIEVRVPVRFYWDEEGFDGIEIGPFRESLSRYQRRLTMDVLNALPEYMHPVPKPFLETFNGLQKSSEENNYTI